MSFGRSASKLFLGFYFEMSISRRLSSSELLGLFILVLDYGFSMFSISFLIQRRFPFPPLLLPQERLLSLAN
jgi:hypothetical protein